MIGAERGYKVKLALPKNASIERKQSLLAYGAELVLTDPTEGTDGAQRYVEDAGRRQTRTATSIPTNTTTTPTGRPTTKRPPWKSGGRPDGRITHFVTGLGTSGTFMGVTRRLKELNPAIQCISMQPDGPLHGLEGLKHMPTAHGAGHLRPDGGRRADRGRDRRRPRDGACGWRARKGCWSASPPARTWWRR